MASSSESSHANNVANFDELISFTIGYGTTYNPSKTSIKVAGLQTVSTNSKTVSNAVNAALPAYRNAVDAREAAFLPLSKLIRRVLNFLKSTDTTDQVDESANTLVRKIIGTRATPKKTDAEKEVLAAEGKEVKEISSSQMGYDNRIDNLDKLIKMLSSITLYAPNEADLKVSALTALYLDLKAKNLAVASTFIPLSNARIARNDVMYKDNIGLYDIAADVKLYVKSVFGATSPQYKQISGLKFTKPR
jgi:hypothetical protein